MNLIRVGAALAALCLGDPEGIVAQQPIDVRIEQGRLSLHVEGAPLADVLHAIGDTGDFAVVLRGDLSQPVDRALEDQPLENALQQLVEGHSLILKRDRESGTLAEIRVIASRAATPMRAATVPPAAEPIETGATAAALEPDDRPDGLFKREAFRQANLGMPAPIIDDIRFALAQDDQDERAAAIPKVSGLLPAEALSVLEGVLAEDEDPLVRSRAVAALTRMKGNDASGLLRTAALGDREVDIRVQALNALAASREAQRRTTTLARAMREDPDFEVRRTALLAMQRVGGEWARGYLERSAPRLEPELRRLAEEALLTWPKSAD